MHAAPYVVPPQDSRTCPRDRCICICIPRRASTNANMYLGGQARTISYPRPDTAVVPWHPLRSAARAEARSSSTSPEAGARFELPSIYARSPARRPQKASPRVPRPTCTAPYSQSRACTRGCDEARSPAGVVLQRVSVGVRRGIEKRHAWAQEVGRSASLSLDLVPRDSEPAGRGSCTSSVRTNVRGHRRQITSARTAQPQILMYCIAPRNALHRASLRGVGRPSAAAGS
ncbi:hypothetical protein BC834DRAFT_541205 [Gloeopeniophorella convolvens]|nr:hypothetical protein BC834DRAFT_541205 [Gloeopeniophorella convolvens]